MSTDELIPLPSVSAGTEVVLVTIDGGNNLRQRLNDMGLNEGMKIKVLHSHKRGPCIVRSGQTRLVLGYGMAHKVLVRK